MRLRQVSEVLDLAAEGLDQVHRLGPGPEAPGLHVFPGPGPGLLADDPPRFAPEALGGADEEALFHALLLPICGCSWSMRVLLSLAASPPPVGEPTGRSERP